jgi:S1-C subfamily serine protease
MKKIVLFSFLFLSSCSQLPSPQEYTGQASDGILQVVWRVGPELNCGSGFVISYKGKDYLCTAAHVVSQKGGILELRFADGKPVPFIAGSLVSLTDADCAFFSLMSLPANVKRWDIASAQLKPTQAIGYANGENRTERKGSTSKITMEIDAPIESGMSGGIVIQEGKAVGIITNQLISGGKQTSQAAVLENVLEGLP